VSADRKWSSKAVPVKSGQIDWASLYRTVRTRSACLTGHTLESDELLVLSFSIILSMWWFIAEDVAFGRSPWVVPQSVERGFSMNSNCPRMASRFLWLLWYLRQLNCFYRYKIEALLPQTLNCIWQWTCNCSSTGSVFIKMAVLPSQIPWFDQS